MYRIGFDESLDHFERALRGNGRLVFIAIMSGGKVIAERLHERFKDSSIGYVQTWNNDWRTGVDSLMSNGCTPVIVDDAIITGRSSNGIRDHLLNRGYKPLTLTYLDFSGRADFSILDVDRNGK